MEHMLGNIIKIIIITKIKFVIFLHITWCSVMSNSLWPHGLYSPWSFPGQNTGVGILSLLQEDLPNPGIEPRTPTLQADSLPAEPQRKPKNTRVGSLSLPLRGIFPTLELNQGLLHCRQILYQLNYQGSPIITTKIKFLIKIDHFSTKFL